MTIQENKIAFPDRALPQRIEDGTLFVEVSVGCNSTDIRMGRESILDTAKEAVLVNRENTHGSPEESFTAIAKMWSTLFGVRIEPWEVPLALGCLKIIRAKTSPQHADNWVDLAGYAACGGELALSDR